MLKFLICFVNHRIIKRPGINTHPTPVAGDYQSPVVCFIVKLSYIQLEHPGLITPGYQGAYTVQP